MMINVRINLTSMSVDEIMSIVDQLAEKGIVVKKNHPNVVLNIEVDVH